MMARAMERGRRLGLAALMAAGAAGAAEWEFFAFDNGAGRGTWPPEKQAATLKSLGYDGCSYNYTNNKDLETWIRVYREAGLKIYGLYFPVAPEKTPAWNPAIDEAISMLKGSETVLWITVPAPKTMPVAEYDQAVTKTLRTFGDLAQGAGLKIAIYAHAGCHAASAADSLRIARMVGHPAVRPSYNLCHEFLTGNGDKAMETLRAVAPEALRVSINGVDPADRKRYILTLDEGSFDIAAFLAELKRLGYRGPVGHQFYNIPGEPEVNLKKAMEAWRKVQPK
jgi:sugar phosphate isomerase/epimerase